MVTILAVFSMLTTQVRFRVCSTVHPTEPRAYVVPVNQNQDDGSANGLSSISTDGCDFVPPREHVTDVC